MVGASEAAGTMPDARAQLAALCRDGIDWQIGSSRVLPKTASARKAAVLVLFGRLDSVSAGASGTVPHDLDVLLLRRAATLGNHPGQIAFPGGRLEPADADATAAAVREAVEETALDATGIDTLGTLAELPLPVSNHVVTPVVAWWSKPTKVAAVDQRETLEVFRIPVADLLAPANRASVVHEIGRRAAGNGTVGDDTATNDTATNDTIKSPAFTVDDKLVWGFTAIVLSRMFDSLGWATPWDRTRLVRQSD